MKKLQRKYSFIIIIFAKTDKKEALQNANPQIRCSVTRYMYKIILNTESVSLELPLNFRQLS